MVISGTIRTRYHPRPVPNSPSSSPACPGDTAAALAFVRTYGLLGYAQVAAAVGHRAHSDAPGDPPPGFWAHAETVALCLLLTYGSRPETLPRCSTAYARCTSRSPPRRRGPRLIVPAVWDQPRGPGLLALCCTPRRTGGSARAIRRDILNAHLLGVRPAAGGWGATDQPSCQFQALLAVVYWHLLQLATQGTVQRCAEVSCQAFFVPTRRTQRFCPPEAPARASRCAARARHRRRGGRPPGAGQPRRGGAGGCAPHGAPSRAECRGARGQRQAVCSQRAVTASSRGGPRPGTRASP